MTPRRLKTVLREHRQRAKLTQEELAKRAKVTRVYIAALEAGARGPKAPVRERIRSRSLDRGLQCGVMR